LTNRSLHHFKLRNFRPPLPHNKKEKYRVNEKSNGSFRAATQKKKKNLIEDKICMHLPLMTIFITERQD
jgi:hypothetical protein